MLYMLSHLFTVVYKETMLNTLFKHWCNSRRELLWGERQKQGGQHLRRPWQNFENLRHVPGPRTFFGHPPEPFSDEMMGVMTNDASKKGSEPEPYMVLAGSRHGTIVV